MLNNRIISNFYLFSFWIIFSRAIDLFCTFIYTPDLKNEASFIVSLLKFEWIGFLVFNIILTACVLYFRKKISNSKINLYPKNISTNFITYLGYILVGKKCTFVQLFYQLPKKDVIQFYIGKIIGDCLVGFGFLTSVMWFLFFSNSHFKELYITEFMYLILFGFVFIVHFLWFIEIVVNYKKTLKK